MTRAWIAGEQAVCCRTDSWINSCVTSSFGLVGRGLWVFAATRNIPVDELKVEMLINGSREQMVYTLMWLLFAPRSNRLDMLLQITEIQGQMFIEFVLEDD